MENANDFKLTWHYVIHIYNSCLSSLLCLLDASVNRFTLFHWLKDCQSILFEWKLWMTPERLDQALNQIRRVTIHKHM